MKSKIIFWLVLILYFPFTGVYCQIELKEKSSSIDWFMYDILEYESEEVTIIGNPVIVECEYGKAIYFNGISDGFLMDYMPLNECNEFTIEVVFYPESGGENEQRFFHCGEVFDERVLMELRSTSKGWYFDSFIQSGKYKKALLNPELLHPHDQWYHVAYVCSDGKLQNYVNGQLEMEESLPITPLKKGKTSIGVRQNKLSWFKGAIYLIRVSLRKLNPAQLLNH